MRHYAHSETVDAVVIGTGAGGAPLMARLAGAGLSVVALEAGPYWNPAQDFATDERSQSKLFWNDDLSFDENLHVNFDWYHPRYAHRHTEEEVRGWCEEADLDVTRFHVEPSGFTVRAVKR